TEDDAQFYGPTDPLTTTSRTLTDKPKWGWKYMQMPVTYDVETKLQNDTGDSEVAPLKLVQLIVKQANEGCRRRFQKAFYDTATTDAGTSIQSVVTGIDHARTYGTLVTTSSAKTWWNGASLDDTFTDRNTAYAASIANFRKVKTRILRYQSGNPALMAICSEEIFDKLKAQVEARHIYTRDGSRLAKYGFETFMIDGVEVVQDSWLSLNSKANYFLMLTLDSWELRIHPMRSFTMTDFVWQGDRDGGRDEWLSRILIAGNNVCWQPNANYWGSNWS
ncbi:MAG: hypothetical protein AMS14_10840, partial [Planctomycetes bacterium DG_20]